MITQKEFDEFVKHYSWEILKYPDYRVGQAFINYFPTVMRPMSRDDIVVDDTATLFYNRNNEECWTIIRKYVK
ncbi:hypothetical protein UFOVP181_204 [uncultured Caudovirales phage]|uniref:Uncharacterized protein n=1 Tax=uncultured Caudovirales phage TaxID=2100421 RepID=A0A6J7WEH9_9CAUD|nr:hypothetical protein UFOVP57_435 [uncultured Caudovirales phage]CAB5208830.1 hypothetical protein UFOVP181_204 [uncultured Caudovirales phage]